MREIRAFYHDHHHVVLVQNVQSHLFLASAPGEEHPLHALELSTFHDPQRVALDWNLPWHLSVVHSPEETAEQAGQMPTTQIEATKGTACWSEASKWQLRQVVLSYSDFHVSDSALIVSPRRVILTIEQLNVCGDNGWH